MINLLPTNEKQKFRTEYHLLVASVCLPALSAVLLIAILSFLPTFFLSTTKHQSLFAESQSKEAITKQSQEQEMKKLVSDANAKISLLKQATTTRSAQDLFHKIFESRPSGVYITNFSYNNNSKDSSAKRVSGASIVISVQGKADDRADLLSFVDVLNKTKSFSSVELPISNLVSGTNLSYSLNIVVSP
jgi:Tfp pilus assembly protein PilN